MSEERQELSPRELEILQLVARGASNKEIAQRLFISTNTVKVHLRNIFSKIGVSSRTEAAMFAVSNRMVPGLPEGEAAMEETSSITASAASSGERASNAFPQWFWILLVILGAVLIGGIVFIAIRHRADEAQPIPSAFEPPVWEELSPMPTARYSFAMAATEDYIFAIGGENADGITSAVERYDVQRNRWRRMQPKPTPVSEVQAVIIGGKVFVPGGLLADGSATSIMEVYLPQEDRWIQAADLPQAVSGYALAAFEGKLYLFGGRSGNNFLKSVYRYDPDLNLWQRLEDLPEPRAYASAVVSAAAIHLLGGFNGHAALDAHEVYQPSLSGEGRGGWQALTRLPEGRYRMAAVSVADGIYILGGVSQEGQAPEALMYLSQAERWQPFLNPLEVTWEGLNAVAVGTKIYALGGNTAGAARRDFFAYQVIYIVVLPIVP